MFDFSKRSEAETKLDFSFEARRIEDDRFSSDFFGILVDLIRALCLNSKRDNYDSFSLLFLLAETDELHS